MDLNITDIVALNTFGKQLGEALQGGECLTLSGDVGAGKTTLVKAIADGMGVEETVSSPSYTLSQVYTAPSGLRLAHYDFYRLDDPGILKNELMETVHDQRTVTAVEWSQIVASVLPTDCLEIHIHPLSLNERKLTLVGNGTKSKAVLERLQ